MDFAFALSRLIGNEGGYVDNSVDPGGATNWGITARVARSAGYTGDMRFLTREQAADIYLRLYWRTMHCDEQPDALAFQCFDAAANSGTVQATKWLQQAIGVTDDGIYGPHTSAAAKAATKDDAMLIPAYRLDLMTSLPTWGAFGKGWARRISTNLKYLAKD